MTLFWTIAAGLILLALAFATLPLLRNKPLQSVDPDELNIALIKQQLAELDGDLASGNLDQTQYDAARRDLERELLRDVNDGNAGNKKQRSGIWALAVIAAGIPLLAVGVYQNLGSAEIISRLDTLEKMTASAPRTAANRAQGAAPGDHPTNLPPMDQLVEKLHQKLLEDPTNVDGWLLLGRSYSSMGRIAEAMDAYQKAYQQAPEEPDVLVNYAQVLARQADGSLSGQPAELVRKAYQIDPQHPTALWMMGLMHFEQGEYQTTIDYWQQLAGMMPSDSNQGKELARYIAQAEQRLHPGTQVAMAPAPRTQPAAPSASQAKPQPSPKVDAGGSAISVRVSLDPALASKVSASDRVFIFARALSGPPMPLAAVSKQVSDLPLELTLDDSMAMMPQMKLSSFPQVLVGARISKSGTAMPQSGDLQGEVSPITPGQSDPVSVVIDSVRP